MFNPLDLLNLKSHYSKTIPLFISWVSHSLCRSSATSRKTHGNKLIYISVKGCTGDCGSSTMVYKPFKISNGGLDKLTQSL